MYLLVIKLLKNTTSCLISSVKSKQYSDYVLDLSSLIRIDLSCQWVNEFDDNHQIYKNLNQIKELNIRQNLITNWSQLWIILETYFPRLEIINVSNSRMKLDLNPSNEFIFLKEFILIDTDNDCDLYENIFKYFPNLINIHLDLNRLSFISEIFVERIKNLTNLSLSDNPTLIHWDPFINRLGILKHLQELIINNCGIETIKLINQDDSIELFPSLKYLYMSDNKICLYSSINELSRIKSLMSFSILRNPIYGLNQIENETAKQMIIARLPNLTHLNRVSISRDERRGAEIDYLQSYAQDYFDKKLDFINEHRQYQLLIEKHGEPLKPIVNQQSKKGLCIRSDLLRIIFEFGDENETKIEKKIPSSMTIAKLKTFVRRLFSSQLTNDIQFNLFVVIDKKHKELISNDYQDIQFYLGNYYRLYAVSGRLRQSRAMGFTFSVHPESFGQLITTWEPNDKFGDPHDLALSVNGRSLYVGEIRPNRIDSFNVLN
ncbi:unnamed protein product [Rotaria socialis]|uniref:Uncharacterized protein n=1 Tax=Rotaria socialis TaxID=392032 RepID=A0A821LRQ8_9BILA|nr:unnamed protein product [Rotaria socialis]CAF4754938.1 unnamed protein product [Rotaria socialis]